MVVFRVWNWPLTVTVALPPVTGVAPTGKVEPEGGTQVTVVPAQVLETGGVGKLTTAPAPEVARAIRFGGQVIWGGPVASLSRKSWPGGVTDAEVLITVPSC